MVVCVLIPPFALTKNYRSKRQLGNILRWPIYNISVQVIMPNYPVIIYQRRSSIVSLETYPFNLF